MITRIEVEKRANDSTSATKICPAISAGHPNNRSGKKSNSHNRIDDLRQIAIARTDNTEEDRQPYAVDYQQQQTDHADQRIQIQAQAEYQEYNDDNDQLMQKLEKDRQNFDDGNVNQRHVALHNLGTVLLEDFCTGRYKAADQRPRHKANSQMRNEDRGIRVANLREEEPQKGNEQAGTNDNPGRPKKRLAIANSKIKPGEIQQPLGFFCVISQEVCLHGRNIQSKLAGVISALSQDD